MNHKHILGYLYLLMTLGLPLTAQQGVAISEALPDTTAIMKDFEQQFGRWQHVRAVELMETEDYAEVLLLLDGVLERAEDAMAHYNRGIVHRRMKNHAASMNDFGKAIALDPKPEYYYARGLGYLEQGDTAGGLADLQQSLTSENPNKQCMMYLGTTLLKRGGLAESAKMFSKIIAEEPDHPEAIAGLCIALIGLGDTATIMDMLELYDLNHPARKTLMEVLGFVWFSEHRYEEAYNAYREALQDNLTNVPVMNMLAVIQVHLGNLDSAWQYCDRAMTIDMKHAPTWNTRGVIGMKRMDYSKAEADLTMAITLEPTYAEAYYNRAYCREMQRNDRGACEDLQRANSLGLPESGPYHAALCP